MALPPAHRQIEFTPEEKRALAEAITKAAGRDWEPVDTCVADIADYCASSIADPTAIDSLDPDSVAECFSDPENWKSYDEAK